MKNNLEVGGVYRANVHQRYWALRVRASTAALDPSYQHKTKGKAQEVRSDFYILLPLQARGDLGRTCLDTPLIQGVRQAYYYSFLPNSVHNKSCQNSHF